MVTSHRGEKGGTFQLSVMKSDMQQGCEREVGEGGGGREEGREMHKERSDFIPSSIIFTVEVADLGLQP